MIHPSSIVSKEAVIADDAFIGPFCVIKGQVKIGSGTRVESHAVVGSDYGVVEIGENNVIAAGSVIGGPPQDLKYKNDATRLVIGNQNQFRECVTVNLGTVGGGGVTQIGNQCLIMAYSHIAHDCLIGDDVVIANSCQFAGHITIGNHVKIGGVCCFNQFVRIGDYAYIAGDSAVNKDVLPYTIAQGRYAVMRAANKVGLERAGFPKEEIENVHRAIRTFLFGTTTVDEAIELIEKECKILPPVANLIEFMRHSERGLAR